MHGIHFCKERKQQSLKIKVGSINKDGAVCDLRLMALTRFELNFAFQIDIPRCEQSLVEIGINSPYGKLQFRMVSDDLIGRLPLFYEG